ncbi:MAG: hypothetical protein EP330_26515 [Deltaproteobacteria bacterium]|nr:MAG: hypothetical protein EP330_26515 [Deltaproteobacteria bacterium]
MTHRLLLASLLITTACGSSVSSEEEAELAYLGLDGAISRAMDLGFQGFNAADSANIDAQTGNGDESGTMTITGQIDQGNSDNKGMRLFVALEEYQDLVDLDEDDSSEVSVTYWTDPEGELPTFDLQLRNIPTGTLEGTFAGTFQMEGDLEGDVVLDVDIAGSLQEDGSGGTEREPGTVTVVGTAVGPGGGEFAIDITL